MKKIVIIYNKFKDPGGAERLAVNFLKYLERNSIEAELWTTYVNENSLFSLNSFKLINLKCWIKIYYKILREPKNIYIVDSGFLQFYVITIFVKIRYFVHLHHPLFMSFNDNDKYSIIHKKWLNIYLKSNYGAQKLIKPNFTLLQICFINIRAIFFMNFIKRAEEVFVLSEFSKKEKKDLFNINAIVLRGALTKVFPYNYDKHKNIKTIKFLMVGRLDKNKRIDILLKIFYELISDTDLNLELDIIGTGSELTILKNLCSSLKIDKFVNFHGFICDKDLENFYHKSHLFISLDWADYKLTMFEALNYSCFVIVTKETELTSEIERSKRVFKTELESNSIKLILAEILVLRSSYKFSNEILEPFLWSNYFNQTLERIKN